MDKNMEMISDKELMTAFKNDGLHIFTDVTALEEFLLSRSWKNTNLLWMSSGNFGNLNIEHLAQKITTPK